MNCRDVEPRLSAYLDGELDDRAASALRGHLRLCEACRQLADNHAATVDVLASLASATPEPPPALWDGVLARLGEAEVADARRSTWWLRWQWLRPHLLPATAALAMVATVGVWAVKRGETAMEPALAAIPDTAALAAAAPLRDVPYDDHRDAVIALGDDAQVLDEAYRSAADELLALIALDRATWTPEQATRVDARIGELRAAVAAAEPGEPRERAWQALVGYLQRVVTSDRVALASGLR
jgi:hypothetical protein